MRLLPYKLTFERRDVYLYALVQAADIDRGTALAYLREVAVECERQVCDRLLLERDIPVMLPDGDLFFTTHDFFGMMTGRRVAFINPHVPIDADMDFAVAIAASRGAQFRLCRNLKAAEEWLASD
jgi:hypothetical protein